MGWTRGHILGRGSAATVSIAASTSTSTSTSGYVFAVKSMDLSQSESLQREHNFLSFSSSPYVVSYRGCDITIENNNFIYNLMMEYMPGGTILNGGRLNNSEISNYTRQILEGLEYLHSHGIVHCDIKGTNILVGQSGAKIADLGCAKWAHEAAPIRGTPMFMAPEVARGQEQGFAADIWALGCTVIEMATGCSPWPNFDDPVSVLYRIAFSDEIPEMPDKISNEARDFVSKCLMRDPKERWTAKQLLKHPYLAEFNTQSTQIIGQELDTGSPTSILDQDVWKSMEESTSVGTDFARSTCSWTSHRQRIKQLVGNSKKPTWKRDEETHWMTIRSNGKASGGAWMGVADDEVEVNFTINGGEDYENAPKVNCRCSNSNNNTRSGNSSLLMRFECENKSNELFTP